MKDFAKNLINSPEYDIDFLTGIFCLCTHRYKQARQYFLQTIYNHYPLEDHYGVYQSYLALANVLVDYEDNIVEHCYHSSDRDLPKEPEVQLNIACAEFLKGNRREAFQALEIIKHLKISRALSEDIQSLMTLVGSRKEDDDGLLEREKLINKTIGKFFRKKEQVHSNDIEDFIIDRTRQRYNHEMRQQAH